MCDDVFSTWIFQKNGSYHPLLGSGTNQLDVNISTCWTGSIQSARGDRSFGSNVTTCQLNMALDYDKLQLIILYLHRHIKHRHAGYQSLVVPLSLSTLAVGLYWTSVPANPESSHFFGNPAKSGSSQTSSQICQIWCMQVKLQYVQLITDKTIAADPSSGVFAEKYKTHCHSTNFVKHWHICNKKH